MKKSIFLLLASIMMLTAACNEEQPTKFAAVYDKHTIQEDTNWVEITDIDTVETCIIGKLYINGLLINSEEQYKNLFIETLKDPDYLWAVRNHPELTKCREEYQIPDIDFNKRDLIMYLSPLGGGQPIFTRRIFENNLSKEIVYLVETRLTTYTKENSHFAETITIPKLKSQYTIKFDTLLYFPE